MRLLIGLGVLLFRIASLCLALLRFASLLSRPPLPLSSLLPLSFRTLFCFFRELPLSHYRVLLAKSPLASNHHWNHGLSQAMGSRGKVLGQGAGPEGEGMFPIWRGHIGNIQGDKEAEWKRPAVT